MLLVSLSTAAAETHTIQRRHAKFFSLCQHFQNGDDITVLRSNGCVYTAGSVPLHRWKTEVLSADPYVVLYYDFVTDREAAVIVNKATVKVSWLVNERIIFFFFCYVLLLFFSVCFGSHPCLNTQLFFFLMVRQFKGYRPDRKTQTDRWIERWTGQMYRWTV